jgi:hypothetical protein
MPHQLAAQDPSFSSQPVTQSDSSSSSSPGLARRFSELQVGARLPPPPDFPPRPQITPIHTHINDLPIELVGEIITQHSELEWYAPAVDGQVCRYWRTTVLSTPRSWARIKFERVRVFPSESAWRLWIDRAASSPLDVRILVHRGWSLHENALEYMVSALLTKADSLVSLDISGVRRSFFLTPFRVLRHLRIDGWSLKLPEHPHDGQFRVTSMPALRSLTLGDIPCGPFATCGAVPPLSELSLSYNTTWHSLVWHSHKALTSLSLHCCGPWAGGGNSGSGSSGGSDVANHLYPIPIEFPSLLFLSLYDIPSFKPYITSPRLQTLHEASDSVSDSFPVPLTSVTEYGVLTMTPSSDNPRFHVEKLHSEFPNLVRLSLRVTAEDTLSFFLELAEYPACFHNLRWIEAENYTESRSTFNQVEIMVMQECLVRRTRAALSVPLNASFWEPGKTREIPLFFADVRKLLLQTFPWSGVDPRFQDPGAEW